MKPHDLRSQAALEAAAAGYELSNRELDHLEMALENGGFGWPAGKRFAEHDPSTQGYLVSHARRQAGRECD